MTDDRRSNLPTFEPANVPTFQRSNLPTFFFLLRWALVLAWVAAIYRFSDRSQPLGPLSGSPHGGLIERAAHVAEYAGLALLLHWALDGDRRDPRTPFVSLALTLAFAVFDEAHQHLVPGRAFQLDDLAYDTAGATAALGLLQLIRALILSVRVRRDNEREVNW
jgi:VanZ family protein